MSNQARKTNRSADNTPVNGSIRAREVRVIDENEEQLGVMNTQEALRLAESKNLDLVCVAPQAKPPVCRIMQWSKYRFRQQKKEKEQRKQQREQVSKDIRFSPVIADHDYQVKVKQIRGWLEAGHRVRAVVRMSGRQQAHPELAITLCERVIEDVRDVGQSTPPSHQGRDVAINLTHL